MKPTKDTNILDITSDSLNVDRQAIPDCSNLQESIIKETQNLDQHKSANLLNISTGYLVKSYKTFINNIFRYQAIAATTTIIITTFIITSDQTVNPIVKSIEPIDHVVWEELWLMQDELAFSEI